MAEEQSNNNIIGFFASFSFNEIHKEAVREMLWGENGFKEKLKHLKWMDYGIGLELLLFEINLNPELELLGGKEVGNYRPKEKSIGIPLFMESPFFDESSVDQKHQFANLIIGRLLMLDKKITRNNLQFDLQKLIADVTESLNSYMIPYQYVKFNCHNKVEARNEKRDIIWSAIGNLLKKFIPEANPDFDDKIERVNTWLIEFDLNNFPSREIGLNKEDMPIVKMPWKDNYGYWTDNNLYLSDFKSRFELVEISGPEFDRLWHNIQINYEGI